MSKFKVGDKVRVVYVRSNRSGSCVWHKGAIVTIQVIEPGEYFGDYYECGVSIGKFGALVLFDQLEPITDQLSSWEEIQSITNWNPSKQGVTG